MKNLFLILGMVIINLCGYCQRVRYFRDFDFANMQGRDSLSTIIHYPGYFIKCTYNKVGELSGIDASGKVSFNYLSSTSHIEVLHINGNTFLFFGAGKQRTGYTRAVFQRKIYETDSAIISHDTIIYKLTSERYIRIQLFTKIGSDTISYSEVDIPFATKKERNTSPFISLAHFREWFTIQDSLTSRIITGSIVLNNDILLARKVIKSNGFVSLLPITSKDLKDYPGMPVSFFWLKNSGFLN